MTPKLSAEDLRERFKELEDWGAVDSTQDQTTKLSILYRLGSSGADLRQRFPTPRRTMPSYRELFPEELKMLRETMVKTPESTSDGLDTVGNIRQNVLYWAPRVLLLGFIV